MSGAEEDEKLKKQSGYTKDKAKFDSVKGKIDILIQEMRNLYEKHSNVSSILQDYDSEYNKDLINEAKVFLSSIDKQLEQIGQVIQEIENSRGGLANIVTKLTERIDGLSDEFAEIKREIKDDTLDVDGL